MFVIEYTGAFSFAGYLNDTALNGLYLLGFHNQSYALQKKKEEENHE